MRGKGTSALSPLQKVQFFRSLFRGRTDVYPVRWESRNSGKSGYAPACANEWRAGVCEKPRIRCADCAHRVLLPLDEQVIYAHLAVDHTVGLYPLMPDGTCYLLHKKSFVGGTDTISRCQPRSACCRSPADAPVSVRKECSTLRVCARHSTARVSADRDLNWLLPLSQVRSDVSQ